MHPEALHHLSPMGLDGLGAELQPASDIPGGAGMSLIYSRLSDLP